MEVYVYLCQHTKAQAGGSQIQGLCGPQNTFSLPIPDLKVKSTKKLDISVVKHLISCGMPSVIPRTILCVCVWGGGFEGDIGIGSSLKEREGETALGNTGRNARSD